MMCNPILNLSLLYKATRDGFKAHDFHSLCDNQSPTICLIKSSLNKTFGGYAHPSWHSEEKDIRSQKPKCRSFLFQLDYNRKLKYLRNREMGGYRNWSIIFGNDIYVHGDSDKNEESYCKLGKSYELPDGMQKNTELADGYLAG
jgi:hypothetical protein